ncbi:MAG: type II toxin-antitoxin system RelE family toxin [Frankiaceae bacterium]
MGGGGRGVSGHREHGVEQDRLAATTTAERIRGAIALLAQDPRPPATKPLRGRPGWRLRVGDCRILYVVHDDGMLVVVVAG